MSKAGVPRVTVPVGAAPNVPSQPNVLRMVYMPNEKMGKIKDETDQINAQIQQ